MIEVSRDDLGDLPQVMALVRQRRERFILFVDDLSFEEGETQYKTLKAVLEGSLEARPKNVLIYASSNRRHLIQEYFSDRNDLGERGGTPAGYAAGKGVAGRPVRHSAGFRHAEPEGVLCHRPFLGKTSPACR